ncbi:MAG TPA: response regulator transcription factor, partial [Candidatus Paceibacterota bacterium]
MRILLIESDSSRTDTLTTHLEAEGHEVLPTDVGDEGASLVYAYTFDLILLSFELSDLPGMEVLRKMRVNAKTQAPIIILSADTSTATTVAALNAGADDFVGIPLDLEVLLAR